jgi:hypothetical protein
MIPSTQLFVNSCALRHDHQAGMQKNDEKKCFREMEFGLGTVCVTMRAYVMYFRLLTIC